MVVDKHFIYNFAQTWKEPQCPSVGDGIRCGPARQQNGFQCFCYQVLERPGRI